MGAGLVQASVKQGQPVKFTHCGVPSIFVPFPEDKTDKKCLLDINRASVINVQRQWRAVLVQGIRLELTRMDYDIITRHPLVEAAAYRYSLINQQASITLFTKDAFASNERLL